MSVDRIIQGQLNNTDTAPLDGPGTEIFDAVNGVLDIVDNNHGRQTMITALAVLGNQLALASVTTAQQLLAMVLNGGLANSPGRRLRLEFNATYNTTSANVATLTLALLMGGTPTQTITVVTNPAVGSTVNANGTLVTLIANGATPVGNQVALGSSVGATATALYTFLSASADVNIAKSTWTNPSSGVVLSTALVNGYLPTWGSNALQDFTLQYGLASGQTVLTIVTAASNTAATKNLQIQGQFDLVIPQANAPGGASPIVGKGKLGANLTAATTNTLSWYGDVNIEPNTITIGTNPAAGGTMNVNGTLVTWIANGGTPVGNQVALGTTATGSATALYTFLAASTDANISKTTWTNPSGGVVLGTSKTAGWATFFTGSVAADYTTTTPAMDLSLPQVLSLTIAASGSGVPAAQLQNATLELIT
jgi:hypothetical protein